MHWYSYSSVVMMDAQDTEQSIEKGTVDFRAQVDLGRKVMAFYQGDKLIGKELKMEEGEDGYPVLKIIMMPFELTTTLN